VNSHRWSELSGKRRFRAGDGGFSLQVKADNGGTPQ
jgi:hypothetical protein